MDRVSTINHKGKSIILVDVSNFNNNESLPVINEAQKLIASRPAKTALVLMDVTNCFYNAEGAMALKLFARNNSPYIKASASVGAKGLRLLLHQATAAFAGREIKAFDTRNQALDWLAEK
jgi:hypothetical protein